ncbi:high light inducible protein [Altericista sp. CCNU0014]|uniref:high light inducible protein n=1 Tax=Altericista sp. CCNU0014 TaxID=3082949 RepID=UPI00384E439F
MTQLMKGLFAVDPSSQNPDRPEANKRSGSELARPEPKLGWTAYAEQINGRFAMIGLAILLLLEAVTHQSFLSWLGL